jgi:hypothetical protein
MPDFSLTTSRRCSQSLSLQWTGIVLSSHKMITCIHTKTLGQPSSSIKNIKKFKISNTLSLASSARLSPIQVHTCACLFFAQLCTNAQLSEKQLCINVQLSPRQVCTHAHLSSTQLCTDAQLSEKQLCTVHNCHLNRCMHLMHACISLPHAPMHGCVKHNHTLCVGDGIIPMHLSVGILPSPMH